MVLSEVNSPLAFGAAIAPCIIVPFESKLPEQDKLPTPSTVAATRDRLEVKLPEPCSRLCPGIITLPIDSILPLFSTLNEPRRLAEPFAVITPEAFNTATRVLTSPAETTDAEENGFSLKLEKTKNLRA